MKKERVMITNMETVGAFTRVFAYTMAYNRPDVSLKIKTKRPFGRRRKCQILYVLS